MAGSRRTVPLPPDWRAVTFAILARDPVCRWGRIVGIVPAESGLCNGDSEEVDHFGAPWDHRPEVLRGICHYHHLRRTSMQANAAKALLRAQKTRPADNHPGYRRDIGTANDRS
jgi:5-methylcytosine-specific restriction enzyme A